MSILSRLTKIEANLAKALNFVLRIFPATFGTQGAQVGINNPGLIYATTPAGGAAVTVNVPRPGARAKGHAAYLQIRWLVVDRAAAAAPNDVIAYATRLQAIATVSSDGTEAYTVGAKEADATIDASSAALTSATVVPSVGTNDTTVITFTPPIGYPRALDWIALVEAIVD